MRPQVPFPPVFAYHLGVWHHAMQTYCGSTTVDAPCGKLEDCAVLVALQYARGDLNPALSEWRMSNGCVEWSRGPLCAECFPVDAKRDS